MLQPSETYEAVETGLDPLSLPTPDPPDDPYLHDYSLCGFAVSDSPRIATGRNLSPTFEAPECYVSPEGGVLEEPYVLAGGSTTGYPKGSLDFSNIPMPGEIHEASLDGIPPIYPSLTDVRLNDSSPESFQSASDQSFTPVTKPRRNPLNDENLLKKSLPPPRVAVISPDGASVSAPAPRTSHRPIIGTYTPPERKLSKAGANNSEKNMDEMMGVLKGGLNNAVQFFSEFAYTGQSFDSVSCICFLGRFYQSKHHDEAKIQRSRLDADSSETPIGSFQDFISDFRSRVWVTYRRGFVCLPGTSFSSDTGWGCMLRTGQMLLATVLQIHSFGRGWRRPGSHKEITHYTDNYFQESRFRGLIKLFGDSLSEPFSLQQMLKVGKEHLNKAYGEWYGPSSVSYVIRVCVDYARQKEKDFYPVRIRDFTVYTATDCMVFRGDIVRTATNNGASGWNKTLVLISVRMGGDELNPAYQEPIQTYLSSSICLGIIGGRKRHSLYFTGFQGSKLIHYDPHRCQPVLKMEGNFKYESYVCSTPRKMAFSKMDPSCTFAFYLSCEEDLAELGRLSSRPGVIKVFEILEGTKEEYMTTVFSPSIMVFDHNENMVDDHNESMVDINSLEGSDFEYLD